MEVSVLDELGQEITGIIAPVSICMALTVLLVKALNPDGSDTSVSVYFAQAFYAEKVQSSLHCLQPSSIPKNDMAEASLA